MATISSTSNGRRRDTSAIMVTIKELVFFIFRRTVSLQVVYQISVFSSTSHTYQYKFLYLSILSHYKVL
eukprot:SAG11_NODE_907_length_6599_cov_13.219231_3_plen_69_part_00